MIGLADTTAFVVGGSGGVGQGVVEALLAARATVVATGRDQGRLDALAARTGAPGPLAPRLRLAVLDALADDLQETAEALVATHGRPDLVVVSVASWGAHGRKPLLAHTDAEWDAAIAGNQTAVFRLYRALVPLMSPAGALVQLNGLSAELPFPGAAPVAAGSAATKSLTRSLAAELGADGPRVHELVLGVVRTRRRRQSGLDDPRWVDARAVGDHVVALAAGTSPLSDTVVQRYSDAAAGPRAA